MRRFVRIMLTLLVTGALGACAGGPVGLLGQEGPTAVPAGPPATIGALTIADPWARPANPATPLMQLGATTTPGQGGAPVTSAAYMTIANSGTTPDALVAAAAPPELVDAVELHTVTEEGGMMRMRQVERINIPAGGEAVLEPGSFHVMLIGLKQELKPGAVLKLRLTFEGAGTVEVSALVRAPQPTP